MNPTAPSRVDPGQSNIVLHSAAPKLTCPQPKYFDIAILGIVLIMLWSQSSASQLRSHANESWSAPLHVFARKMLFSYERENIIDDDPFQQLAKSLPPPGGNNAPHLSKSKILHANESLHQWKVEVNQANENLFYIRAHFSCKTPRPKVVKVAKYHKQKQTIPR